MAARKPLIGWIAAISAGLVIGTGAFFLRPAFADDLSTVETNSNDDVTITEQAEISGLLTDDNVVETAETEQIAANEPNKLQWFYDLREYDRDWV